VNPLPRLHLAPMQDVSVLPLWRCLERRGGPDVYVTEYFRVHRNSHPDREILRSITAFDTDKPVIAQMIGNDPDELVRTARHLQDHTPCAGIDLNLGCPSPTVCGKTAGGALLRQPDLIRRIVATLRPVVRGTLTLKTRIGFDSPDEFEGLLDLYAGLPIDGLAVHGRTVRERYQSEVHTGAIARAVNRLPFPVVANGSIVSAATAVAMAGKTGAAGLMLGRGAIRDPWIFAAVRAAFGGGSCLRPSLRDLHGYLRELADEVANEGRFDREIDLVNRLKKFTNYIASGISGGAFAQELRRATSLADFEQSCQTHLDRDEPFPAEPDEDGTLFCGFRELAEAGRV
jgi:tRNA-dihydrouridine synthase